MSVELIISIVSLAASIVIGIFTIVANIRVSKINNTKDLHEYERNITYFELSYKDEKWLHELLEKDEFRLYNSKSQKRIYKWWDKYQKKHIAVLLKPEVEFKRNEIINSMKLGPRDFKKKDNDKSDGSLDW